MSAPIDNNDNISQKITKLLPADITAALLGIKTGITNTSLSEDWIVYGGIVIALLAPAYFYFVVKTTNPLHIIFLVLTYLIFFLSIAPIEIGNVFQFARQFILGTNIIITPIWVFIVTPIIAQVLGRELVT
jgi:hypothetical protein